MIILVLFSIFISIITITTIITNLITNTRYKFYQFTIPFRKRVYLYDRQGNRYKTSLNIDKEGVKWAFVNPITQIGHVILNDDNSCRGVSSYIHNWSYIKKPKPPKETIEDFNKKYI